MVKVFGFNQFWKGIYCPSVVRKGFFSHGISGLMIRSDLYRINFKYGCIEIWSSGPAGIIMSVVIRVHCIWEPDTNPKTAGIRRYIFCISAYVIIIYIIIDPGFLRSITCMPVKTICMELTVIYSIRKILKIGFMTIFCYISIKSS